MSNLLSADNGVGTSKLAALLEESSPGSQKLYLIFGGIMSGIGMPPFEFYNSAKIIDENKIFFRDPSQAWYQNGLPGIAENPYQLAEYIGDKIDQYNVKDVYFIGNSMGGFAAIMFAAIIGRGKVVAFCPQTSIHPSRYIKCGDFRWNRQILRTYGKSLFKRHVYDLRSLLKQACSNINMNIYVSTLDSRDVNQAQNIANIRNVTIKYYDVAGHNLVRYLRDKKKLEAILRS